MDHTFKSPSILSLCPGFLGLERGLIRAIGPIRVAAYVEIEAFIIANLVAAMEQGILAPAPIWSDIKTLNGSIFRGKIDGIIGGYPCQPFSLAGQRGGTEDPRHLYPFISGIIKAAGPLFCFFENVSGHLTLGFPEVSADLRAMDYAVEAGIYSAEEAGAPQERDRLFILAIKSDWLENSRNAGVRRRHDEGIDGEREIQVAGSDKLEHTNISNVWDVRGELSEEPAKESFITNTSREMGDTASPRQQEPGQRGFGQLPQEERSGIYNRPEQSSDPERQHAGHLADTEGQRLEGPNTEGNTPTGRRTGEYDDALEGKWPARPGERQYDWEEPRVKSRLGSTINGYNFREDLLRAYGNSVVEQTAEIAFIDLLNKHFL